MPDSPAPVSLGGDVSPEALLHTLLAISITGVMLLRPIYAADGATIVDLAWVQLNPAAQLLLRLPERPAGSFLTLFPAAQAAGIFDFYREAFLSGQVAHHQHSYPPGGNYQLVAQRQGGLLVVSFAEASERPRPAGQPPARAEARTPQADLLRTFEQAPVAIAILHGPAHTIEFANSQMGQLWGRPVRQLQGQPHFVALPDLAGQGLEDVLDEVYCSGETRQFQERAITIQQADQQYDGYFNITYQPTYAAAGHISGLIAAAVDVTEQVLARQQVQALHDALATTNEELELRVTARSAETRAALFEAEQQREQLRVQQGLLSQILGQVPAAIATLSGPAHRYSFFNEPYQALAAGRTALGRTVAEVFPEMEEQGFIGLLDQVYATGQPFIGAETVVMFHDRATGQAEPRHIDFICQPLLDQQQQPQGILAFILDVTDRVRARKQAETLQAAMLAVVQRQAQERENLYQLFEQAPAAICLLREPEHRIDYLNPAYQALFPGQALRGQPLATAQPAANALVARLDGIYQSGKTEFENEVPVVVAQPGGQPPITRHFDFTYQAYREAGQIVGVSLFAFDVSERVLARRQRDAQQAELQRLFEHAPVAIGILRGPAFVVELANTALGTVWGRPPAQVLGQPFFEALPDLTGQGFEQLFADILASGEPLRLTEVPVQLAAAGTGQPTTGYFNCSYQPWPAASGEAAGMIAVALDVTEQVLARQQVLTLNQELRESNRQLTRTNADLDTFVYTASHDLRAPISNIEGLLLALRSDLPAPALEEPLVLRLLDLMQNSVERFQQTIGHLTDISQLQQPEAAETVDLTTLIDDVRLDLAPLLEASPVTLTVSLRGCEAVRVAPKTLRSVVYNLLSNAAKYRAPERPARVQLRGSYVPGWVVLEVQDNGLGLTPEQQGQLFGMFRRLHTHVEGSGVGLFMVKRLVENAGGTITVASQLGVGSTFTVSLPA